MQWLNKIADRIELLKPEGQIIIESGVSPSGTYHVGTLREVLTCDAILLELKRRGRQALHTHYVDDLDPLRKVPVNVPEEFEQYLGHPYCDVPAPDGSAGSYADYFLNDFLGAARALHLDMQIIRSHQKYRSGHMIPAVEKALNSVDKIRLIIEEVSGRKLEKDWAPIQVLEDGYLKNRRFVSIDIKSKTLTYLDAQDSEVTIDYSRGAVKLNWRVDWPARWWLFQVDVEPFGRDHATKGGSYDTGAAIMRQVFDDEPPLPVPYNFINEVGQTKKMSKSSGNIIAMSEMVQVLPPEVVRFFTLRYPPDKLLFFDPAGVAKLIDDYAALLAKVDKTEEDKQLIELCNLGSDKLVSSVPFSHLITAYQAALKDPDKTLQNIKRTEYAKVAGEQQAVIKRELGFIDRWLATWAPPDARFELLESVKEADFSDAERKYLEALSQKIANGPAEADGEWFHKAIYELDGMAGLTKRQLFTTLYRALIGKEAGPRAGWFLSTLPRDWLIKRLRLEI